MRERERVGYSHGDPGSGPGVSGSGRWDPTPSVGNLRLGAEVAGRGSGSRVGAARSGAVRRDPRIWCRIGD